ncbi:MAG: acyltransferase [Alteromonadaceae bacterium]|nr:acyltransferase [Alteromonadaceae bacterium]
MKLRPLLFGFRTFFILLYLKTFHRVEGWKYFFGSWSVFRVSRGSIKLSSGVWIEEMSLCHCEGGEISIGCRTFLNRFVTIVSRVKIGIGKDVLIGDNVSIYDHDHQTDQKGILYSKQGFVCEAIKIDDNVWIGSHSVILKGVNIGKNSVIAAGSVVTNSIPSGELWGGVPAKFIKRL